MNNKSVISNILWNTAGNIIYLGCQWLLSVVVVRISGSYADAGILTLAISVTNIFTTLALFNVRNYQVSDISEKYTQSDYISHRILTCIAAVALCVTFADVSGYSLGTALSIIAYMLMRTVEALADVFHGILQKQWRLDVVGKSCIFRGIALITGFTVVYKLSGRLPAALFVMAALTAAVFVSYDIRVTGKLTKLSCQFNRSSLINLSKDCLPVLGYGLLINSIALVVRFCIERYHGEEMLGYYGSVSTIAVIVQAAANFILVPLNGVIGEYYAQGNRREIQKLAGKVILLLGVVTGGTLACAAVFGKFALVLLFGKSIEPYTWLLIPTILASCLTGLAWFLGMILIIIRKMKALIIGAAVGAAVSIVLSAALVPKFVFDGANVTVIAALCISIVIYVITLRNRGCMKG